MPLTTSSSPAAPGALDLSGVIVMRDCASTSAAGVTATAARSWMPCRVRILPSLALPRDRVTFGLVLAGETVRHGGGELEVRLARRGPDVLDRGLRAGLEHRVPRDP